MSRVFRVPVGLLSANCYIVQGSGADAVLIDPGADVEKIDDCLSSHGLIPRAVLLTHAHFDHCNAAYVFQKRGCKIYLHADDEVLVTSDGNLANEMGLVFHAFHPDRYLADGDKIEECGLTFTVLHTPGHTGGSVCYLLDDIIFTGDTLFCMSVGRTDLPTGNVRALLESVRNKLFTLDGDYTVYPGHGDVTTLAFERRNNPYA